MNNKTPFIDVGIQFKEEINVTFNGAYKIHGGDELTEKWHAEILKDKISLSNNNIKQKSNTTIVLTPTQNNCYFTLHNVTIGINFHWERDEDQSFKGGLKLIIENNKITAINQISLEDYLTSVISSEMSATSSMELLKAHAVISRSWLLAQIEKNKSLTEKKQIYSSVFDSDDERIKWYDREDHENFDVCADDHCQRYQGITRSTTKAVEDAVKATHGEVLLYNGEICDARFSKCCGGMVETFENVWEPITHPYLQKVLDNDTEPKNFNLNLEIEENVKDWILGSPEAFCNTNNKEILNQVLNDYDQETNDFYRWKIEFDQKELSILVKNRTGIDFGTITDLIPIKRGASGRLMKLKIVGDKKSFTIGKELEIRKSLSESHLYSSAFVIKKEKNGENIKFILQGAGWGHGVGLCQIGAAVMAHKGYSYNSILKHYYKEISLKKKY